MASDWVAAPGDRDEESRLLTWGWRLFLALVAVVPLIQSNVMPRGSTGVGLLDDQFSLPKAVALICLTAVSLALWALATLLKGGKVRVHWTFGVIGALAAWWIVTTVTSVSPALSIVGAYLRDDGLVVLFAFAAVYFLAVQYVDGPQRLRTLAEVAAATGALVAVYGFVQAAHLDPLQWRPTSFSSRIFSTLGNPDPLGAYLAFLVPIGAALAITEARITRARLWWGALALIGSALAFSLVRTAFIGGAVGVIVFGVGAYVTGWRPNRRSFVAIGIVVLVILGSVAITQTRAASGARVIERAVEATSGTGYTYTARIYLWKVGLTAASKRPLLGYGPATYERAFSRFATDEFFRKWPPYAYVVDSAHSTYIETLATMGAIGLLLTLIVLASALSVSARTAFRRGDATGGGLVLTAWWAALASLAFMMFATVTTVGTDLLFWLAAGLLVAPRARSVVVEASWLARVGAGVLAASAVVVVGWACSWLVANQMYLQAMLSPDPLSRSAGIERAIAINPLAQDFRYQRAQAEMAALVAAAQSPAATQQQLTRLAESAISTGADSVRRDPWDLKSRIGYLATLVEAAIDLPDSPYPQKALAAARSAVEMWPRDPVVLYQYAYAARAVGNYAETARALELSTSIDPTSMDAWTRLGEAREALKDTQGALAAYRKALALDLTNAEASAAITRLEQQSGTQTKP